MKQPAAQVCLFRTAALIALFLLFSGCTTRPPLPAGPVAGPQWPPPPEEARIVWVGGIHDREDAGIRRGLWERTVGLIAGDSPEGGVGKPYGIFVDNDGRLFVADAAISAVHLFDQQRKRYSVIGSNRQFKAPIGLSGDGNNAVFITDPEAGTVYRYDVRQDRLVPFLVGVLARPTGIVYHRHNGLLYIADTAIHQIVVFDLEGRERFRIGARGEAPGQFNFPTDLFLDAEGSLYVTDALNARIQAFSADGHFLRAFGAPGASPGYFAKPKGVAVDSEGHIYVADALQDSIQIFDRDGRLLLVFGSQGGGLGQFWMPSGIFIDSNDVIYVADTYNRRVQIFRYRKIAAQSGERR